MSETHALTNALARQSIWKGGVVGLEAARLRKGTHATRCRVAKIPRRLTEWITTHTLKSDSAEYAALRTVSSRTWLTENAAISLAVAILLALQIFSVGFTSGAMAKGGDVFGVVCATDKASPTNSNPSSPVSHHVDMCCVLHSSAAVEPDAQRSPPGLLSKEAPPVLPAPTFDIDAICADPELRPLSPRAPPARSV